MVTCGLQRLEFVRLKVTMAYNYVYIVYVYVVYLNVVLINLV